MRPTEPKSLSFPLLYKAVAPTTREAVFIAPRPKPATPPIPSPLVPTASPFAPLAAKVPILAPILPSPPPPANVAARSVA